MSTEDHKAEAEAQLRRRATEYVDRYAGSLKRSKGENDMRTDLRDKIEELGRSPKAFQHAVMLARTMKKSEAHQYLDDVAWFAELLLGRQGELFADDVARMDKRDKKKADKAASQPRTQAELDAQTDASERSAPDAGGAKPQVPVDNSAEQAEGDAALEAMTPQTKAASKKRAQSAIANEIAEAAGTIN